MTTYAWFSANEIMEIESFDFQVATKGGIEISADGIDFKGVIGMKDFLEAENTYRNNENQMPNYIRPVSTTGFIENGKLKMFYGEVNIEDDLVLKAKRSKEEKGIGEKSQGDFVAFDIFLRVREDKNISLANTSGVTYGKEESGIANAFRIAFINEGTVPIEASKYEIQSLNRGYSSLIWELNTDSHTEKGIKHAKEVYNIDTSDKGERIPYYGIREEIPESKKVKVKEANSKIYPQYFSLVNPQIATIKNYQGNQPFLRLRRGITKIRVYVYIEGQDVDCEDGASFGNLIINLEMVANR